MKWVANWVQQMGFFLCSLGVHKWPKQHEWTRQCQRCIHTEAVDARTGRWVQL